MLIEALGGKDSAVVVGDSAGETVRDRNVDPTTALERTVCFVNGAARSRRHVARRRDVERRDAAENVSKGSDATESRGDLRPGQD